MHIKSKPIFDVDALERDCNEAAIIQLKKHTQIKEFEKKNYIPNFDVIQTDFTDTMESLCNAAQENDCSKNCMQCILRVHGENHNIFKTWINNAIGDENMIATANIPPNTAKNIINPLHDVNYEIRTEDKQIDKASLDKVNQFMNDVRFSKEKKKAVQIMLKKTKQESKTITNLKKKNKENKKKLAIAKAKIKIMEKMIKESKINLIAETRIEDYKKLVKLKK